MYSCTSRVKDTYMYILIDSIGLSTKLLAIDGVITFGNSEVFEHLMRGVFHELLFLLSSETPHHCIVNRLTTYMYLLVTGYGQIILLWAQQV